jgi:hypothetical protein
VMQLLAELAPVRSLLPAAPQLQEAAYRLSARCVPRVGGVGLRRVARQAGRHVCFCLSLASHKCLAELRCGDSWQLYSSVFSHPILPLPLLPQVPLPERQVAESSCGAPARRP